MSSSSTQGSTPTASSLATSTATPTTIPTTTMSSGNVPQAGTYSAGAILLNWKDSATSTFFSVGGSGTARRINGRASGANVYYAFAFSTDQSMVLIN